MTYIASTDFISHVQWLKSGNQNDLVAAHTDLEKTPSTRATCAVVGTVSPNQLFLEPHGNFNLNFEKTMLETSKAQFQLILPTLHLEFDIDFNHSITHIETIQTMAGASCRTFCCFRWPKKGPEILVASIQKKGKSKLNLHYKW